MARRRQVIVVKHKRGCLVQSILILVLVLLIVILFTPIASCVGCAALIGVATHDAAKRIDRAGETTPREPGAGPGKDKDAVPEATAPRDDEPAPVAPVRWDEFRVDGEPDPSRTEKENQERLIRYVHAGNRALNAVRVEHEQDLATGWNEFCGLVYPRLIQEAKGFTKLPRWVQERFMQLLQKRYGDDAVIEMVRCVHALAREWAAGR